MSNQPYWKIGPATPRRPEIRWPSPAQIIRQIGMIALVSILWGGLLAGYLSFTGQEVAVTSEKPVAQPPPPTAAPVLPTATAAIMATHTLSETTVPPTATPSPTATPAGVSFTRDVYPILEQRCIKCHDRDGEKFEEGLDMTSYDDIMAGSWNGPILEPGNAEESFMVEQLVKGEMPKKEPRLLPGEIRIISAWIDAGAPNN
jgi:hypothetical protein